MEKAEATYDASFASLQRAVARHEAHPGRPRADFQRVDRAYRAADAAKCTEAELHEAKAESDWLRARLAERDAEIDLLMLQWGHSNQQLDSSVATASEAAYCAQNGPGKFRCSGARKSGPR